MIFVTSAYRGKDDHSMNVSFTYISCHFVRNSEKTTKNEDGVSIKSYIQSLIGVSQRTKTRHWEKCRSVSEISLGPLSTSRGCGESTNPLVVKKGRSGGGNNRESGRGTGNRLNRRSGGSRRGRGERFKASRIHDANRDFRLASIGHGIDRKQTPPRSIARVYPS